MERKKRQVSQYQTIEDETINTFLAGQDFKTRKFYTSAFRKVLEFTQGESGKKMLEEEQSSKLWSRKIFALKEDLLAQDYSKGFVQAVLGCVRGFFQFYKVPLSLSPQEKKKINRKGRKNEDYPFSQSDFKRMSEIGNLKEKYVALVGASFGLRAEDFTELTYGRYRIALEKADKEHIEAPIPMQKIPTEKETCTAQPIISSDALPIIRAILDAGKDKPDNAKVWDEKETQLTTVLQVLFEKAGLDAHGSHVRFHCMRKYLSDRLSTVASESKWKQIIGKKIGEREYISDLELRDIYERAQPLICVTNGNGETKRKVSALELQLEQALKEIGRLTTENGQLQKEKDDQKREIASLKETQTSQFQKFQRMFDDYDRELLEVQHCLGIKGKAVKGEPDVT